MRSRLHSRNTPSPKSTEARLCENAVPGLHYFEPRRRDQRFCCARCRSQFDEAARQARRRLRALLSGPPHGPVYGLRPPQGPVLGVAPDVLDSLLAHYTSALVLVVLYWEDDRCEVTAALLYLTTVCYQLQQERVAELASRVAFYGLLRARRTRDPLGLLSLIEVARQWRLEFLKTGLAPDEDEMHRLCNFDETARFVAAAVDHCLRAQSPGLTAARLLEAFLPGRRSLPAHPVPRDHLGVFGRAEVWHRWVDEVVKTRTAPCVWLLEDLFRSMG